MAVKKPSDFDTFNTINELGGHFSYGIKIINFYSFFNL